MRSAAWSVHRLDGIYRSRKGGLKSSNLPTSYTFSCADLTSPVAGSTQHGISPSSPPGPDVRSQLPPQSPQLHPTPSNAFATPSVTQRSPLMHHPSPPSPAFGGLVNAAATQPAIPDPATVRTLPRPGIFVLALLFFAPMRLRQG